MFYLVASGGKNGLALSSFLLTGLSGCGNVRYDDFKRTGASVGA